MIAFILAPSLPPGTKVTKHIQTHRVPLPTGLSLHYARCTMPVALRPFWRAGDQHIRRFSSAVPRWHLYAIAINMILCVPWSRLARPAAVCGLQ